jgi:hypothetical protein
MTAMTNDILPADDHAKKTTCRSSGSQTFIKLTGLKPGFLIINFNEGIQPGVPRDLCNVIF